MVTGCSVHAAHAVDRNLLDQIFVENLSVVIGVQVSHVGHVVHGKSSLVRGIGARVASARSSRRHSAGWGEPSPWRSAPSVVKGRLNGLQESGTLVANGLRNQAIVTKR